MRPKWSNRTSTLKWDTLGLAETKVNIALGLQGDNGIDFWLSNEGAQTPQVVNRLTVGDTTDYTFKAKHGLNWDNVKSFDYDMVFTLSMDN